MLEVMNFKMQLVSDGTSVRIDIEPPLDRDRKELVRDASSLRELPEVNPPFHDLNPDSGSPFTEINCAEIRTGAEYRGLKLDEVNFAREIRGILEKHGDTVELDTVIKPVEQSGHLFLSLGAERPKV